MFRINNLFDGGKKKTTFEIMSSIFLLLRSTVDEKSHIFKVFMRVRTRGVRAICHPMCSLFEHRQELQQSAGSTASVRIISLCFLPFHHKAHRWPTDEGNLRVGNGCDLGTFDHWTIPVTKARDVIFHCRRRTKIRDRVSVDTRARVTPSVLLKIFGFARVRIN